MQSSLVIPLSELGICATSWPLLGALTATCFVLGFLQYHTKPHPLAHLPGPKPSSFLFGNMFEVLGAMASWQTLGNYPEPFLSWIRSYGGVVRVRQLFSYALILSDPKAIQHVFLTHADNYPRDPMINVIMADILLGVSVASTNGALHTKYRKLFAPHFTAARVKSFLAMFKAQALVTCERLLLIMGSHDHATLDLQPLLHHLTLNTIGLAACGLNFDDHPNAHAAYKNYTAVPSVPILVGMLAVPGFMRLPLPEIRRRRQAQDAMRQVITDVIDAKLAKAKGMQDAKLDIATVDFLDAILPESTVQEAVAHTMTVLSGGQDTTSSVLSWTLAVLATHPRVVALLRAEHADVMQRYDQSLASPEAVSDLKYTLAVIQESMRLNMVSEGVTTRTTQQADRLPMEDGTMVEVPAGTQMMVKYGALHRNPRYWTRPDEFIPDRFIEHSVEWNADLALRHGQSHAFYYMPFSAGVMNCVGSRFALAEMQIIIATLVSRFDFELTADADLRHTFTGGALHPTKLAMHVRRVQAASA
ncbi:Aste57867_12008 [Aphanomyces stellatus]|uniref:Aste57867_12008 protein n=1 Tax=Aphanomyces stellatus TaxID=120398 RepID=A0A485KUX7_9STRA|nr:hypothetical protein As57867_011963 [Aphanomyces stellatus]VFT88863.1 Aste57867_12008 [Aphanomyces stellatus]